MNHNLIEPRRLGIADGDAAAASSDGDELCDEQQRLIAMLAEPQTPGSFRVGTFLKAKTIAYAEGFIAAYRSETEHR